MAGSSGTPLHRKLGIRTGVRVALIEAPPGFAILDLPDGVRTTVALRGRADVIVLFVSARDRLAARFAAAKRALAIDGGLWIAWPKKASGVVTDLDQTVVMEIGLAGGLVDNKVCAIDDVWSALRFVYRLADRPPKPSTSDRGRSLGASGRERPDRSVPAGRSRGRRP